jgi:hypothetical protein
MFRAIDEDRVQKRRVRIKKESAGCSYDNELEYSIT